MTKKRTYLVVDTESGLNGHCIDYASILVVDNKVREIRNFLLEEFYLKESLFYDRSKNSNFSKDKIQGKMDCYKSMLFQKTIEIKKVKQLQAYIDSLADEFPTLIVWAYNVSFDRKTLERSGIVWPLRWEFRCLWRYALSTVTYNPRFPKWCIQNDRLTSKFCLSTSADTVIDFIRETTNAIPDGIVHSHYALADCYSELYLLRYMLKLKVRSKIKAFNYRDWKLKNHI